MLNSMTIRTGSLHSAAAKITKAGTNAQKPMAKWEENMVRMSAI